MNQDDLMSLLVCPICRGKLVPLAPRAPLTDGELTEGLCCDPCALVYPVRENIPVLLPDKAVPKSAWDEDTREDKREAEQCVCS